MTSYQDPNQTNSDPKGASPRKRRSFTKFFLVLSALIFLFVLLTLAALPTLLSSRWGNDKLIAIANQQIPGTLSAEKISLNWFGPQELQGVLLKDIEGNSILSLKKGISNTSLFRLLLKDFSLAGLSIESLNGTLTTDGQGNTNFERAINKKCCHPKLSKIEKPITIMFKNVNALVNLDTSRDKHLSVHLAGETLQNTQSGSFTVDAQLNGITVKQLLEMDQQSLDHLKASGQSEFKVNAEIINLPVILIDQFIALRHPELAGILQEALGQQLNLKLNQTTVAKGLELALTANSANMQAVMNASMNEVIALTKPLTISLKITPQLIKKLAAATKSPLPWQLKSATTAEFIIDTFQYPSYLLENKPFEELDLTPLALNATLKLQPTTLSSGKNVNVDIQQLAASLSMEANNSHGKLIVKGDAKYNENPFAINLNTDITKPKVLRDFTNEIFRHLNGQGNITGLPIALVDTQLGLNNQLSEIIGNTADINLSINSENDKPAATLSIKSDSIDIPALTFSLSKDIALAKPAIGKIYISPEVIEKLILKDNSQSIRLRDPTSALVKINKFMLPLENTTAKTPPFIPDSVTLDIDVSFSSIRLTQIPNIGEAAINDLNLHITGKPLSQATCTASGIISQIGESSPLNNILGNETKISAFANLRLRPNRVASIDSFELKASSPLAQLSIAGAIQDNILTLTTPAIIRYTLTPAALQSIGLSSRNNFSIKHASPLEFKISQSKFPLNDNALSELSLAGDLKIKDLILSHSQDSSLPEATLDGLSLHWTFDTGARIIRLDFDGTTHLGQQQDLGTFSGNAVIDNWTQNEKKLNFDQAIVHLKVNAYKLPAAFIGTFITATDITPLIGNSFETNISANINLSKAFGTLALDLRSELLAGSASFSINNGIFLQDRNKPAQFNLTLTPKGYSTLRQHISKGTPEIELGESAHLTLLLRSLNIPGQSSSPDGIPFWKSAIDADITIDKLVGLDKKKQSKVILNVVKGHISSQDISQHTNFVLNADGKTNTNLQTNINITGSLEKGFSSSGSINRNDLSLNLDASLSNLPVPMLCQLACLEYKMSQKLNAVIGSNFDAKIKAQLQQMNGPIYIEMKGEHGHTVLDGLLSNGTLTLNNNFYAELSVTPQLGTHVLQDLIPFLSGILGSDQPLKLAIAKEGFALPLQQFSLENISIGGATLELGKVRFSNEGQIAKVLSLLTTASANEIMVWLTPTYFSLNRGLFDLQRVDMLISDRYPIAAWGKVNIPADNVNMVIALSGAAINRAFSVPGIKKGFMLQLPLRGTMKNTSIDKSKAVARLSALVAQSQGGPQGMVLGTVLDIAGGGLTEDLPPSPTTNPLPWSQMMEENSNQSDFKTPVEEINKIIPIEEISKGAGSLLKKIFKR